MTDAVTWSRRRSAIVGGGYMGQSMLMWHDVGMPGPVRDAFEQGVTDVGSAHESRAGPSIFAGLLSMVWSFSTVGVVFALFGRFSWLWVLGVGSTTAVLLHRLGLSRVATPSGKIVWLAALVIAGSSVVFNSMFPAEHLLTGRDAGTYVATAGWLAEHGELPIEARLGAFAKSDDLSFGLAGFKDDRADGRLSPQFLHAFPVLMALVAKMWTLGSALRVNAVLGGVALLAVFAFASLMMRPGFALLVEAALAVNLVFVYYSRAPFSEMLAMVFVFGGLWALWHAWESKQVAAGFAAGLLLGGMILTRIDGLVLLIALGAVAVRVSRRSRFESRFWGYVLGGLAVMSGIAAADQVLIDPLYIGQLKTEIIGILGTVVVLIVVDMLLDVYHPRLGPLPHRYRLGVEMAIVGLVVLVAAFAYFVRPYMGETIGAPYSLAGIQQTQGLAIEPLRTYAEGSAHWLSWYLGPVVAVGVLGWALLAARAATGRDIATAPFVLVLSAFMILYVWRPSINPDHIWAMRRFLPVVIPGILVCSGWVLDRLWDVRKIPAWVPRILVAMLAVVVVAAPLRTMIPLAKAHEFDGLATDFEEACATLGRNAAVLIVDKPGAAIGPRLVQGFRSYCDLPAVYVDEPLAAERIAQLSDTWAADGRVLWVVSGNEAERGVILFDRIYRQIELTLTRPPRVMTPFPVLVWAEKAG